jgi:hypothetical protein
MVNKLNVRSFLVMSKSTGALPLADPYEDGEISHNFVHRLWKFESVIQLRTVRKCSVSDKRLSEETGQASSRV